MARLPSSMFSYRVDWDSLDDAIDGGVFVRWADDPAWRWFGVSVMDLVQAGRADCPVCVDTVVRDDGEVEWINLRRPGQTCPWCLRRGAEERIPTETPPRHVARAAEIKFKAKIDGTRRKLEAESKRKKKAAS